MTSPALLSRRRFLEAAVVVGGWCVLVRRLEARLPGATHEALACAAFADALFHYGASARAVGEAYLKLVPSEGRVPVLSALLLGEQGALPEERRTPLSEHLAERSSRDFALGRVVRLEGWVLSVTDARLCALTALL